MNRILNWIDQLTMDEKHSRSLRVAVVFVYGWFLLNLVLVFPNLNLLWGNESVIMRGSGSDGILSNFIYHLVYVPSHAYFVIVVHALAAFVSMFAFRFVFLFRITTWITGLMLYFSAYDAFNSGFLVMLLFSFFLIPVVHNSGKSMWIQINNIVWVVCVVQLSIVYALSAGYKWIGIQWPSGNAIYYSFAIDRFSFPSIQQTLSGTAWLWKILTWAVLIYQTVFPIVVWIKKWRMKLVVTGILFHLLIAVMMGLWDFGLAMIFAYAFLLPEKTTSQPAIH